MRAAILIVVLLAVPLSGCIEGPSASKADLFAAWSLPAGSAAPTAAEDCQDLQTLLDRRAREEADTFLDQAVEGVPDHHMLGWRSGRFVLLDTAGLAVAADGGAAGPAARDAEVTGTNNQETGVDEADAIKTDGEWTYVLRQGMLYILQSDRVGDISEHARLEVGDDANGDGVLLLERRDLDDPSDDRLVVVTQTWRSDAPEKTGGSKDLTYDIPDHDRRPYTHVRVFGLADRSVPALERETLIEGSEVAARLVEGHAYIVVHVWQPRLSLVTHVDPMDADGFDIGPYGMDRTVPKETLERLADKARKENDRLLHNATLDDHLPHVFERNDDGAWTYRPVAGEECTRTLVTDEGSGRSATTILALDISDETIQDRSIRTLGGHPTVYGAQDALVLAAPAHEAWWFWDRPKVDEATDLQWFDLDGLDVVPRANGRVPGTIEDSFSIDVHDGSLRVATTTGTWGRWWLSEEEQEPMMTHLVLFGSEGDALVPIGMVGGIAPGEQLWSARFTDTRAYLITYQQIDPLWIIDLTDKTAPTILGELEIPGVSTYIHSLSDQLLLTIGMGPGEDGIGLDRSRLQVSLFDISDETNPIRADVMELSPAEGWSRSDSLHEHKAFTYWDRLGMLAVPMATHRYDLPSQTVGPDNNSTTRELFRHHYDTYLRLVQVDTEAKSLRLHGDVRQSDLTDERDTHGRSFGIERSYFLGLPAERVVSVYTMSGLGMAVHDLWTLEQQDQVAFIDR